MSVSKPVQTTARPLFWQDEAMVTGLIGPAAERRIDLLPAQHTKLHTHTHTYRDTEKKTQAETRAETRKRAVEVTVKGLLPQVPEGWLIAQLTAAGVVSTTWKVAKQ